MTQNRGKDGAKPAKKRKRHSMNRFGERLRESIVNSIHVCTQACGSTEAELDADIAYHLEHGE